MEYKIASCCLPILLLAYVIEANNSSSDGETRQSRGGGRIVKLYSGARPDPIVCTNEGFIGDPNNCSVFYRCMKSGRGRYTSYKFQCPPGTVYDPDTEVCNHPRSTKRSECGGLKEPNLDQYEVNEINEVQELPLPITTKAPVYTTSNILNQQSSSDPTTTYLQVSTSTTLTSLPTSTTHQKTTTFPWVSTSQNSNPVTPSASPISQDNTYEEICTSDGFIGDSVNCHKFYRCVGNQRNGFTKYEFSCSEPTIWDDDIKSCNHPWAVKGSRCGRSNILGKMNDATKSSFLYQTTSNINPITTTSKTTIQNQLQISYGTNVQQSQTQISNNSVVQNQTQINYGDGIKKTEKNKQIQNQISYGSAISQSQTQIAYGNEVVQTQVQIDHSKQSSQSQVQITESTTPTNKATNAQHKNVTKNEQNINNICEQSGFIGDSNDCKKFYRCVDNGRGGFTRHEFSCGEGTLWDQTIEACNHAWAVKVCGSLPEITTKLSPSSSTVRYSPTSNKPNENHYPATELTQSNGFDDVGYNNNHATSPSVDATKPTTEIMHHSDTKCKSSGFVGDDKDCRIFYSCIENGKAGYTKYEFTCGEGTLWDADIGACNHAWAVKGCGIHASSITIETTSIQPTMKVTTSIYTTSSVNYINSENNDNETGYGGHNEKPLLSNTSTVASTDHIVGGECRSSGFMESKNDCKKFYRCVDSGNGAYIRYEFTCGEGTAWDAIIESCNHEWAVDCNKNGVISSTNEVTTQKKPIAIQDNDSGYNRPEGENNSDITIQITTPSTSSINTTNVDHMNKCIKSGFVGDIMDCKKFYNCVDNGDGSFIRYEFACGEGTVWDQKIDACNHVWAVEKCGSYYEAGNGVTTTPMYNVTISNEEPVHGYPSAPYPIHEEGGTDSTTPSTTSILTTSSSATTNSYCYNEGFIGDKLDCKRFYRCVNDGRGGFIKYKFQCGEGTVWDQSIESCNHAWAVNECGAINETKHNTNETATEILLISSFEPENQPTEKTSSTSGIEKTTIITAPTKSDENTVISSTQNISAECHTEGFYGNQNDCQKFYRCVNDGKGRFTKYDFSCGDGTIWNQELKTCAHKSSNNNCLSHFSENSTPTNGPSNDNKISTSTLTNIPHQSSTEAINVQPITTEKVSTALNKCTSEGFHADAKDCRKFIRCVNNGDGTFTKYKFACGEGTVWVQELLSCDHNDGTTSCNAQSGWNTQQQTNYETSTYVNTAASSTQTESVNKEISENNTVIMNTTQVSSDDSENEDVCENEGFYGNKKDCKVFYRCVDNGKGNFIKYDFMCGDGTIWDQDLLTCNHPHDVVNPSCKEDHGATSENTGSSNETSSSSTSTSTTAQTTHSTTQSSGSTTAENSVSTNSSTEKPPNCHQEETSKKPANKNVTCTQAGYYPDPSDCKKFYRCVDWDGKGERFSVYFFECGEGTIWDPALDTCNHEESVYPPRDCSNTQPENSTSGQETTTTEQVTTSTETTENTTTQQPTTNENSTNEQPTTSELTTAQQSTTSDMITTEHSTTTEQFTTSSATSEGSTTQQMINESTTAEQSTTLSSTSEGTTTQQVNTSEQTTTTAAITESSTTEKSTTQESTTSETTTQESTTQKSTTEREQTTTSQTNPSITPTTETPTTEESTLSSTTTQSSEQTSTTENQLETTTEHNSSSSSCPDTDDDQYLFVCPTSFRRHPKYCNLFYQCTEDDDSHELKIAVFTCPNNTIYDESKVQCVEEQKTDKKCVGEIASRHRVKRVGVNYKDPIVVTKDAQKCSTVGHVPFEKNSECSPAFLKCKKTRSGRLRGFVHRCPQNYMYWSISRRCEREDVIRDCKRTINNWNGRWEIPIDRQNVAW